MTQAQSGNPIIQIPSLADLLAKTPDNCKPFVTALGPSAISLAEIGLLDIGRWIQQVIDGEKVTAYAALITTLEEVAFRAQWDADDGKLDALNAANAARKARYMEIGIQALKALAGAAGLLVLV